MRNIIKTASIIALLATTSVASADMLDDRLAKAQKSVENALARLEKAKACIADRPTCIEAERAKVEKAAKRLAKQQADLASVAE